MKHEATGIRSIPLLTREAAVNTVDGSRRTFEVVWTTGAKVTRRDWFTDDEFDEELVVSANAVRLGRLNAGAPFLLDHSRQQIGVIERAWIDGGQGHAVVRMSKPEIDPEADKVFALIEDRIRTNISVGYPSTSSRICATARAGSRAAPSTGSRSKFRA